MSPKVDLERGDLVRVADVLGSTQALGLCVITEIYPHDYYFVSVHSFKTRETRPIHRKWIYPIDKELRVTLNPPVE